MSLGTGLTRQKSRYLLGNAGGKSRPKAPPRGFLCFGCITVANAKLISFIDHQIEAATEPTTHVVNAMLEEITSIRKILAIVILEVDKLKKEKEKEGGRSP